MHSDEERNDLVIAGGGRTAREDDGGPLHDTRQDCRIQALILDDEGGRLAGRDGIVIGDENGAECVIERRVRDIHRRHRLGVLCEGRPNAQCREQVLRPGGHGRGPYVSHAGAVEGHAIHNGDPGCRPQGVRQRTGKR